MPKYTAAIFDLDGTILDTIEDLTDSINFALREHGFPERSLMEVRSFVGNGVKKLTERALPENVDEKELDSVFMCFTQRYNEHCMDKTKPYEGIVELLVKLREQGIKTAVLSNKADFAVQILCRKYFADLFDYAAGMRDDVPKKPAPEGVYIAMDSLKTDSAVYVGDSEVDVLTASNAGLDCIAVDWGFREREVLEKSGAKYIASDLKELLEYIINEN